MSQNFRGFLSVGLVLVGAVVANCQRDDIQVQNFLYDTRMGFGFALPTAVSGPRQNLDGGGFFFLKDDWQQAVILSSGLERAEAEGRYDLRWDQILLRVDGQTVALLPAQTRAVALGEQLFVPGITGAGSGWYELLADGSLRLLRRYRLEERTKDVQPGMLNQEGNVKLVVIDVLMVQQPGKAPEEFRPNRKRVLELFGRHATDVEQYATREGLGWRKEDHLRLLFDYYHQLQKAEPGPDR